MILDLSAPVEELARHLVDVESVSGNEGELADAVELALRGAEHLTLIREGNVIVARTELARAERVVIAGHLDTVPVTGNLPARIEDGVLWGRGAVDMKGGLAVLLSLAAAEKEPSRDVTWIVYDNEEVDEARNGLGHLFRTRPDLLVADFAILAEPTSARIEGGCNGTLRIEARVPGVAAHSARAWRGTNAIHGAAPVLAKLAAYEPRTVEVDGLTYREGLNAVGIAGGIAGNVIPDSCVVTINYRFAPDKSAAQAEHHVRDILSTAGVHGLEVTVVDRGEGCRPGLNSPLAQSLALAVSATGAGEPRAKQGWTDVARFGAAGIPAVNYGPGDPELAHSDGERVTIAEIRQVREGLAAWLAT